MKIKEFLNKFKYWLGAGAAILVIGGIVIAGSKPAEAYVTTQVERTTLKQSVDISGTLETLEAVNLSLPVSGIIEGVYVDVGDAVQAGQSLLSLEAGDALADVAQAQANLNEALAGSTPEDIAIAEAALSAATIAEADAKIDLALVEAENAATIAKAQATVNAAQDDVNQVTASNDLTLSQAVTDVVVEFSQDLASVNSAITATDNVLGVDNNLVNDSFEDVLSTQDPHALQEATTDFIEAQTERDVATELLETISDQDLDAVAQTFIDLMSTTENLLFATRDALDNTVLDTREFSFDDLNALKVSIDAALSDIQTNKAALESTLQNFDSVVNDTNSQATDTTNAVTQASLALTVTKASADRSLAQAQSSLNSAQAAVVSRQAELAQKVAGPKSTTVQALRAGLQAAEARYWKNTLVSPITGVVTAVHVDAGELAQGVLVEVQATERAFKITLDISESDITKISLGDRADVTFEALGDDYFYTALVTEIEPASTTVDGVVFYKATLILEVSGEAVRNEALRSGLSADVVITTEIRPDVLVIPQRAIIEHDAARFARIPNNADQPVGYTEREIKTGLRGDGGLVEVTDGLVEGDTIIVSIKAK